MRYSQPEKLIRKFFRLTSVAIFSAETKISRKPKSKRVLNNIQVLCLQKWILTTCCLLESVYVPMDFYFLENLTGLSTIVCRRTSMICYFLVSAVSTFSVKNTFYTLTVTGLIPTKVSRLNFSV